VIYSTCQDDWGGSEELWGRVAALLARDGVEVTVFKNRLNPRHPELSRLGALEGVRLQETSPSLSQRARGRARRMSQRWFGTAPTVWSPETPFSENFSRALKKSRPDLVIISQAINFDGLSFGLQCLKHGIPYVIISQKAVDFYWPDHRCREYMGSVWKNAMRCYFVSRHNLRLTEQQFGFHFFNAEVIQNPVKLSPHPLPYPDTSNGYRLACVGRLFLLDKGQDMLLRVLSGDKWKRRPLRVSFVGSGVDRQALEDMARLLEIEQVEFLGHLDVGTLWKHYHGLVLPSRSEGMPLAISEAMAAGRVSVVSDAGGNAEIIEDGVTGFVGEANEKGLDQSLERAWARKEDWEQMGIEAFGVIRKRVHILPEDLFVNHINTLMYGAG
jgi:glycosyltransferase involved in cell wall biosynthesis